MDQLWYKIDIPFFSTGIITITIIIHHYVSLYANVAGFIKSHVNYALMWILRILGPIKFCKGPIKISNGPIKFGNLHVFERDMGHWPILRAHHHFGLGLTLCCTVPTDSYCGHCKQKLMFCEYIWNFQTTKPLINAHPLSVNENNFNKGPGD